MTMFNAQYEEDEDEDPCAILYQLEEQEERDRDFFRFLTNQSGPPNTTNAPGPRTIEGLNDLVKRKLASFSRLDPNCPFLNDSPFQREQRAMQEASRKAYREAVGRGGMRPGDAFFFVPWPKQFWTMRELKNRITWLKKERGRLLGKPGKEQALDKVTLKLQQYTRELFRRYSVEGIKQTRDEYNRLRRSKRKIAKRRKVAALMRKWGEKKKAERAKCKSLKTLGREKP
jgi:hypothetical protein